MTQITEYYSAFDVAIPSAIACTLLSILGLGVGAVILYCAVRLFNSMTSSPIDEPSPGRAFLIVALRVSLAVVLSLVLAEFAGNEAIRIQTQRHFYAFAMMVLAMGLFLSTLVHKELLVTGSLKVAFGITVLDLMLNATATAALGAIVWFGCTVFQG